MRVDKTLDIKTRFNLSVLGIVSIVLIIVGIIIFKFQSHEITNYIQKRNSNSLNNLEYVFNNKKIDRTQIINYVSEYLNESVFSSDSLPFDKTNFKYELKSKLTLDGEVLPIEVDKSLINVEIQSDGFEPVIIYKNGTLRWSLTQSVENISSTSIFNKIKRINDSDVRYYRFTWPENSNEQEQYVMYLKYFSDFNAYVCLVGKEHKAFLSLYKVRNFIVITTFLAIILLYIIISLNINGIIRQLNVLALKVKSLAVGHIAEEIKYTNQDEIGEIANSLNNLIIGLKKTTEFSDQLGKGNYNAEFTPLSIDDKLGNSLIQMRENLILAETERQTQKNDEQERNWSAYGQAQFADILRKFDNDINELSSNVIIELVKYLDVIQGGLFILNKEDKENRYLELTGCFAYDRFKYLTKHIQIGEGLVGTCFLEKKTIYITDIPEGYMDIVSGLGDTPPKSILIVPLLLNGETFGVIELASFNNFEKYKIEFVEKLGEIIASTISAVQTNMQTSKLLEQSRHQSEEMMEQEEELRQNMEELQATQEEASRREVELNGTIKALNNAVGVIEIDVDGEILDVNELYLKVLDRTLVDVKGRNIIEFKTRDFSDNEFSNTWDAITRGKTYRNTATYKIKDDVFNFIETYTPIKDDQNQFVKVIGIAYVVSQSK